MLIVAMTDACYHAWQKIPNVPVASTDIPEEVAKKNRYSNVLPGTPLTSDAE